MFCFDLVLICCLCSMGMAVWELKTWSTPSFILGGNPNYDIENDLYEMNCSQFTDDFDILRQLPFPIRVDPDEDESDLSVAQLYDDMKTVRMVALFDEKIVPSSLFCLSKLDDLRLYNVTLKNNALPQGVTKLQSLTELYVNDVPNLKIDDQFSKFRNLSTLSLIGCSLTNLPDISRFNFTMIDVQQNHLTHFQGPINTVILGIDENSFRTLPELSDPEKLIALSASQNPLKTIMPVLKYKNLEILSITDANITFIPPDIDRLEDLSIIALANNKLTHLPINILNLPKLEYIDVSSNLFSPIQIRSIKQTIKKRHSELEIKI